MKPFFKPLLLILLLPREPSAEPQRPVKRNDFSKARLIDEFEQAFCSDRLNICAYTCIPRLDLILRHPIFRQKCTPDSAEIIPEGFFGDSHKDQRRARFQPCGNLLQSCEFCFIPMYEWENQDAGCCVYL